MHLHNPRVSSAPVGSLQLLWGPFATSPSSFLAKLLLHDVVTDICVFYRTLRQLSPAHTCPFFLRLSGPCATEPALAPHCHCCAALQSMSKLLPVFPVCLLSFTSRAPKSASHSGPYLSALAGCNLLSPLLIAYLCVLRLCGLLWEVQGVGSRAHLSMLAVGPYLTSLLQKWFQRLLVLSCCALNLWTWLLPGHRDPPATSSTLSTSAAPGDLLMGSPSDEELAPYVRLGS